MTTTGSTSRRRPPLGRAGLQALRNYLRGWRGAAVLASIVAVAGIALGWSWLLAAGIAPFLVSVLPCVAMCALGLCMNRLHRPAMRDDRIATTHGASQRKRIE